MGNVIWVDSWINLACIYRDIVLFVVIRLHCFICCVISLMQQFAIFTVDFSLQVLLTPFYCTNTILVAFLIKTEFLFCFFCHPLLPCLQLYTYVFFFFWLCYFFFVAQMGKFLQCSLFVSKRKESYRFVYRLQVYFFFCFLIVTQKKKKVWKRHYMCLLRDIHTLYWYS